MVAAKRIDGPAVSTKPTVLVVEDVPVVRMLLAKLLRGAGFQVVEAANGEDAIRIVEAGRPIQLVSARRACSSRPSMASASAHR
jgi:DNA-binding NtrC family response regulator